MHREASKRCRAASSTVDFDQCFLKVRRQKAGTRHPRKRQGHPSRRAQDEVARPSRVSRVPHPGNSFADALWFRRPFGFRCRGRRDLVGRTTRPGRGVSLGRSSCAELVRRPGFRGPKRARDNAVQAVRASRDAVHGAKGQAQTIAARPAISILWALPAWAGRGIGGGAAAAGLGGVRGATNAGGA
jgi:hypothetical protein